MENDIGDDQPASGAQAARDVLAERERQKSVEGWTEAHDEGHDTYQLARVAAAYALNAGYPKSHAVPPLFWPWEQDWWKPKDRRRDLVRAGALIIAEIERLDRAALKGEEGK